MKGIAIGVFVLLYALVTFFGLGPVLFADGSFSERMLTLLVVIVIYVGISIALLRTLFLQSVENFADRRGRCRRVKAAVWRATDDTRNGCRSARAAHVQACFQGSGCCTPV